MICIIYQKYFYTYLEKASYMYKKKFKMIILIIYFKNIEIGDNYSK